MDPITAPLAANVVAVLAPYVAVGTQGFVRTAGKDAYEKAKPMVAELTGSYAADPAYAAKIKRYLDELESDPVTNGVPELSEQEQNHRGWVGNV